MSLCTRASHSDLSHRCCSFSWWTEAHSCGRAVPPVNVLFCSNPVLLWCQCYWLRGVSRGGIGLPSAVGKRDKLVCCFPLTQVSDSGKPQLFSTAFISVRVIEESIYPPAVLPLDIFVSVAGDEYPGGVLGKIHATDQDIYDTLTYSLASSAFSPTGESGALFSVSASDGKIIALKPLDVGHYPLNVTVTDGRYTTAADVSVHIKQATRQALDNSIAVSFSNIAPEEFIGDYWRNFQRALRNIAGVRRSEVQLVSLQPSEQGDLDVLLTLERSGSPYQSQEVRSGTCLLQCLDLHLFEFSDFIWNSKK